MMDQPNKYGMGSIFGNQENFQLYHLRSLLRKVDASFRQVKRLSLVGHGNFTDHHKEAHQLLDQLGVKHTFIAGPRRKHSWHSGWFVQAVESLVSEP